jgi:hypothetical protein
MILPFFCTPDAVTLYLVPCARPVSGTVVVREEKDSRGQAAQPVCFK